MELHKLHFSDALIRKQQTRKGNLMIKKRMTRDVIVIFNKSETGTATIQVSNHCQHCGKPRGQHRLVRQTVNGKELCVDGWVNPCGHTDTHEALILEYADRMFDSEQKLGRLFKLLSATKMPNPFETMDGTKDFNYMLKIRSATYEAWLSNQPLFKDCPAEFYRKRGLQWSTMFDHTPNPYDLTRADKTYQLATAAISSAYLSMAAKIQVQKLINKQGEATCH